MSVKRILQYFKPPSGWILSVNFLIALLVGLFVYSLYVSNAVSYLSDEPETCINCHVMRPEFSSWQHSSHKNVAVCNDCHVPQDNVFSKYFFKAKDGLRHATIFTLRTEPQVIKMHEAGIKVVQENCKACHFELNQQVGLLDVNGNNYVHGVGKLCWDCHREVPHGRVKGLSTTPYARVPLLESPVPEWIKDYLKKTTK